MRVELAAWELRVVRAMIAMLGALVLLSAYLVVSGRGGSAGYLVDTYAVACVAGIAVFAFPERWREKLASAILLLLALSAVIGIGEAATRTRLLPYGVEATFRPTGLAGHPLSLGMYCAAAIAFVAASRWPAAAKLTFGLLFLMATAASQARFATLVALPAALLVILMYGWPALSPGKRLQLRVLALIAGALALAALAAVMLALGFLERLSGGIADENMFARITIYDVFGLVSWHEILLGTDVLRIQELAEERFGLPFIESSLVVFVFQFGLFGAAIFLAFFFNVVRALVAGADRRLLLAVSVFFLVALSNNALSVKSPAIVLIVLLVIGLRRAQSADTPRAV